MPAKKTRKATTAPEIHACKLSARSATATTSTPQLSLLFSSILCHLPIKTSTRASQFFLRGNLKPRLPESAVRRDSPHEKATSFLSCARRPAVTVTCAPCSVETITTVLHLALTYTIVYPSGADNINGPHRARQAILGANAGHTDSTYNAAMSPRGSGVDRSSSPAETVASLLHATATAACA